MAALRKIVTEHLKQITEQAVQKLLDERPIAHEGTKSQVEIDVTGVRAKLLAAVSGPTDGSRRHS